MKTGACSSLIIEHSYYFTFLFILLYSSTAEVSVSIKEPVASGALRGVSEGKGFQKIFCGRFWEIQVVSGGSFGSFQIIIQEFEG